jgi:hypothetical protein
VRLSMLHAAPGSRALAGAANGGIAIQDNMHHGRGRGSDFMSKFDRLASVRHVAQTGAAIGRKFSYALLHDAAVTMAMISQHPTPKRSVIAAGPR